MHQALVTGSMRDGVAAGMPRMFHVLASRIRMFLTSRAPAPGLGTCVCCCLFHPLSLALLCSPALLSVLPSGPSADTIRPPGDQEPASTLLDYLSCWPFGPQPQAQLYLASVRLCASGQDKAHTPAAALKSPGDLSLSSQPQHPPLTLLSGWTELLVISQTHLLLHSCDFTNAVPLVGMPFHA